MEYKLINQNFTSNYIDNLVKTYCNIKADHLLYPTIDDLENPLNLDNIEKGALLLDKVLQKNGRIIFIVD